MEEPKNENKRKMTIDIAKLSKTIIILSTTKSDNTRLKYKQMNYDTPLEIKIKKEVFNKKSLPLP